MTRARILIVLSVFALLLAGSAAALADYREAFRLKPADHEACIRCGHANFQLKRYRDALSDYTRAIELARD